MDAKFGERLKWIRKSNHLTLDAFAQRCGFDKSYVSKLERGEASNPSLEFTEKVCKAFGVTRAWLQQGEGEPSSKHIEKVVAQRWEFPVLMGLSDEELHAVYRHFEDQMKQQKGALKQVYRELGGRILVELLERHSPTRDDVDYQ